MKYDRFAHLFASKALSQHNDFDDDDELFFSGSLSEAIEVAASTSPPLHVDPNALRLLVSTPWQPARH
jgi:hypothetical protein